MSDKPLPPVCQICGKPVGFISTCEGVCLECGDKIQANPGECLPIIAAELHRLREIVDKLPKTADGVTVVPGMVLWTDVCDVKETSSGFSYDGFSTRLGTIPCLRMRPMDYPKCYSTKEAAEAAAINAAKEEEFQQGIRDVERKLMDGEP